MQIFFVHFSLHFKKWCKLVFYVIMHFMPMLDCETLALNRLQLSFLTESRLHPYYLSTSSLPLCDLSYSDLLLMTFKNEWSRGHVLCPCGPLPKYLASGCITELPLFRCQVSFGIALSKRYVLVQKSASYQPPR